MSDQHHPGERNPERPAEPRREVRDREIRVARDIAEAFLTATSPLEVYRRALAAVTPRVGASFASVFLRDPDDPRLLRLVCAHKWPQSAARWLGEIRIMEGRGPTGRAVGRNRAVEVADVFSDPSLDEWWEPARELGFASMIALPLAGRGKPFGAVSFYFARGRHLPLEDRELLGVVAHQIALAAEGADSVDRAIGDRLSDDRSGTAPGSP